MISSDLAKLYLQFYEAELKARDYVVSALAPFISAQTLLVGTTIYFVVEWPSTGSWGLAQWVFIGVSAVGAVAVIVGIASSLGALWSREYGYVPGLGKIESWRKDNQPYHALHPSEEPHLEDRLLDGLAGELAAAAEQNRAANRTRGAFAHRAKICTAIALGCYAVGVIPFAIIHRGLDSQSASSLATSTQMTDKDTTTTPTTPAAPASTSNEPQKTPFPPKENLREGHDKVTVKRDK